MPGRRINSLQIRRYMDDRKNGKTQAVAAARAGFSERSARNIEKRNFQPADSKRNWRTKPDPFAKVWEKELLPLLEREPGLQAKTLLEHIQDLHPDDFPDSMLRTLQRRVRQWRATAGPEKEVIFRQKHPPAWQGISDFTHADELKVTITGQPFPHLLYHYRLACSGGEYAQIIHGGESYTALAEGLQNALWQCGGVPQTHRTDSLSAAYKNLTKKQEEDFTTDYQELCQHYGIEATRNNKGKSHENGSIESPHRHLKSRLNQALLIRGARDFASLEEYKQFLRTVVHRYNRRIHKRYVEELSCLRELPEARACDYSPMRTRVTSSSTIEVKRVTYSVPSRLIGMVLKIHLYDDRLECFVGADYVITLERTYSRGNRRARQINYRHVIPWLARKPQAFSRYIYRDQLFPTLAFKQAWELLEKQLDHRSACRAYVTILKEAAIEDREAAVNRYLEECLTSGRLPHIKEVQELFRTHSSYPSLACVCGELSSYDQLLGGE